MPVQSCTEDGKSGFRWGDKGKCYVYPAGDEKAMGKAKQKAYLQGAAITKGKMTEGTEHIMMGEGKGKSYVSHLVTLWGYKEWDEHDRFFEVAEAEKKAPQEKPGGGNVGKYKTKGPFCGPSGGAPEGSFPANSRKRAIAVLSYARNAPNPEGIRKCVKKHWPDLPAFQEEK